MKIKYCVSMLAMTAVSCVLGATTWTDELSVMTAQTVDVAAGDVREIGLVSGNNTLTKTGAGQLKIYGVAEGGVKIKVMGGTLAFGLIDLPAAGSNAWLRVDASDRSTMTVETVNGTNFVSRWNDANGGAHFVTNCTITKSTWRPDPNNRKPFLREGVQNGRDVIDFGSYLSNKTMYDDGRYGAAMEWDVRCSTIREVFLVVSDTEDLLGLSNLNGPFLLGDSDNYYFHRGTMWGGGHDALLLHDTQAKCANLRNNLWRLDGRSISSPSAATLPAGFHVVNMRATGDVTASGFAHDRNLAFGGLRIAECLVFTSELGTTDRMSVQAYLSTKWRPIPLDSLELADGTTLDVGIGARLSAGTLKVTGTATVKRDGATISTIADRSAADVLISADAKWTADDATVSRCAFLGDGEVTVGGTAVLDGLTVGGKLTKTGKGELVAARTMQAQDIDVRDGQLTVSPLRSRGSFFHADASDASSMQVTTVNGTNFVSRWNDTVGGSCFATNAPVSKTWRTNPADRKAFVHEFGTTGRKVVDFGSYLTSKIVSGGHPAGYGAAMDWSQTCSTIREVFMVVADTPDLVGLKGRFSTGDINGPFLLGDNTDKYHFHRDLMWNDGHPVLIKPTSSSANLRNGVCWLDNRSQNPTSSAFPDGNLHFVNFQATDNVQAGAFGRDRDLAFGGLIIGECIVFTTPAVADESERLRKQLLVKWGISPDAVYDYSCRNVSVAQGTQAKFPYAGLNVTGKLAIGGTVDAVRVAVSDIAIGSTAAAVTGELTLPAAGTIELSKAMFGEPETAAVVKVLSAGSVSRQGKLTGWTAVGDYLDRYSVKFKAEDDGVYATIKPRGLMLILR